METDRKKNHRRYFIAGLAWGITILLIMEIIYPLSDHEVLEAGRVLKGDIVLLAEGILLGYLLKATNHKQ